MIRRPRMKWLLVEWECRSGIFPEYDLVHVRSLIDPKTELHTGKTICVKSGNDDALRAKVVMVSDDKRFLDQQLVAIKEHSQQIEQAAAACNEAFSTYAGDTTRNQVKNLIKSWSTDEDDDIGGEVRSSLTSKKRKMFQQHLPIRQKISSLMPSDNESYIERDKSQQSSFIKMTYDQGTQTIQQHDEDNSIMHPDADHKIRILESAIEEMDERMSFLQVMIQNWTTRTVQNNEMYKNEEYDTLNNRETIDSLNQLQIINSAANSIKKRNFKQEFSLRISHSETLDEDNNSPKADNDLVPIGSGNTFVPKHIVTQIDWNSYTMATRKLLMAVFPRRTLATHSLTGKSSPAFMNKPAKLCLDPTKINDIVDTVTTNCNVKENLVRNAITTKCADENKMYRMRLEKNEKRQKSLGETRNQENIPPAPDTSTLKQTTITNN